MKEAEVPANDFAKNKYMWTMVQDEGFEMRINGFIFFGFSQFFPASTANEQQKNDPKFNDGLKKSENGNHYWSDCNKTVMGW